MPPFFLFSLPYRETCHKTYPLSLDLFPYVIASPSREGRRSNLIPRLGNGDNFVMVEVTAVYFGIEVQQVEVVIEVYIAHKVRCNFIDGDLGVVEGEASDAVFVIDTGWKGAVETGGSQFASFIAIMTSLWQIISICLFNHSFFVINLPCSIWDIR